MLLAKVFDRRIAIDDIGVLIVLVIIPRLDGHKASFALILTLEEGAEASRVDWSVIEILIEAILVEWCVVELSASPRVVA